MLDTNILISMIIFPGKRFKQMLEFITQKHTLVLSSFVVEELMAVTRKKFPDKYSAMDKFLSNLGYELVYTPHKMESGLFEIRDINDYPVLYTAIREDIDILITGDKDFKGLPIDKPEIMAPSEFIDKYVQGTAV